MSVNCIEVGSLTTTGDEAPSPTYVDKNITLYAIPIHPESSPSPSSKRKRRMSPASSSKRPSIPDHETSETIDVTTEEKIPLLERMRLPDFSPTSLCSEEAQEWRKLTIKHMFPGKEPLFNLPKPSTRKMKPVNGKEPQEPNEKSATLPSAQQTACQPPYVSRKCSQLLNPSGCEKQLPKFSYNKDGKTVPATQRPTLAYILVGPKVRGKFDAKRAQLLGLEGRLRGKVARGETVTFMVDDGKGGQMERTVKPEDCIGPSEVPGVRFHYSSFMSID
jgi:ribonuclease Z